MVNALLPAPLAPKLLKRGHRTRDELTRRLPSRPIDPVSRPGRFSLQDSTDKGVEPIRFAETGVPFPPCLKLGSAAHYFP